MKAAAVFNSCANFVLSATSNKIESVFELLPVIVVLTIAREMFSENDALLCQCHWPFQPTSSSSSSSTCTSTPTSRSTICK